MALLRPDRCGSRRQGGCLQHRTEAQPRPKVQDAGGTPALPGSRPGGAVGGGGCPAGDFSESPRAPFGKLPIARESSPRPHDGVDHSRVKQPAFMAFREQGPCPVKPVCDSNVFVVHPCPSSCPSSRDPQPAFSAKPQMWGLTTGSGARNPSHCTWQKPEPAINGKVSRSGRQPSRILCHTGWRMC